MAAAQDAAAALGDDYVSTEHLLVGLAEKGGDVADLLRGVAPQGARLPQALVDAFAKVRGGVRRITSQDPEATYQALEKYGVDLTGPRSRGTPRPGHRPGHRDPPRRAGAGPPHQEQPGAHRRARRRQDRRRRGSRAAHRRRRRAGVAARQARRRRSTSARWSPARSTAASSRSASRRCWRRSRAPRATSSRSSTSCTPSSARARPRASMDAGNMLKPMLARGELRMVGATTLDEYRTGIEKDPALERRFQQVLVGEPSVEDTIAILRGLKGRYEAHHGVEITDGALVAAATLSDRYITVAVPAGQGDRPRRRGGLPAADGDRQQARSRSTSCSAPSTGCAWRSSPSSARTTRPRPSGWPGCAASWPTGRRSCRRSTPAGSARRPGSTASAS